MGNGEEIWVVKENGGKELFREDKVANALRRAGLSPREAKEALAQLRPRLHSGITTKKIYAITYDMLEEMKPEISHRYNLKRALMEMGPEGYVFEDFTARLLTAEGYETALRQIIPGKCVAHEIDVVASKGKKAWMVECKFHNQPGTKCRIQTVLYVYARFLDLAAGAKLGKCRDFTMPWLVTNTKFSEDVVAYAECMDIPLLGWRHPFKDSLEARIDRTKCYPISVLRIGQDMMRRMLATKIITVSDIPESAERLSEISGIHLSKCREIVERAEFAR
jgi:Holliday junction resolvase